MNFTNFLKIAIPGIHPSYHVCDFSSKMTIKPNENKNSEISRNSAYLWPIRNRAQGINFKTSLREYQSWYFNPYGATIS